ncbi:MAG TPA: RidA family protein [Stellaceae bacterium]|nr:RidA family protein [Stellaceae bacterium]
MKLHNPATVAPPTAPFSHGAEMPGNARWLYITGQVGTDVDRKLAPDLRGQAEQAWRNVLAVLAEAGMGVGDLVKVNAYLTRPEHVAAYGEVRARFLGAARPASTLVIVQALAAPGWLVEVEAVAAKL